MVGGSRQRSCGWVVQIGCRLDRKEHFGASDMWWSGRGQ
jgi:hypothetical protein